MENEDGPIVQPLYLVYDEGSSMSDKSTAAVNAGIRELFRAIHGDPILYAIARVGIIVFNEQASVLLPLTELSRIAQVPGCVRSDEVSGYSSVFRLLKSQIESDVLGLEMQGFQVLRPVVFFMSCGKPKFEDWYSFWEELTEKRSRFRPDIVSWGAPGADSSIIAKVATPTSVGEGKKQSFAFLAQDGVNPGDAIREIMKTRISSMIFSANY